MNKITVSALLVAAFALGCATATLVVPPVRAGTSPTRWEYHCIARAHLEDLQEDSSKLGVQGWEMAAGDGNHWCFKRPLPQ